MKVVCKENFDSFIADRVYDVNFGDNNKSIFVILNVRDTYNFGRWFNVNGSSIYTNFFSNYFYTDREYRKLKLERLNDYEKVLGIEV